MSGLGFALALGAFIASAAMTAIALAEERERIAIAGLFLMILTAVITGNISAGICGAG